MRKLGFARLDDITLVEVGRWLDKYNIDKLNVEVSPDGGLEIS
jgi:hypothetical protein